MPGFFHKGIILPSHRQIWVNPNPLDDGDTETAGGTKAEREDKYVALLRQGQRSKKPTHPRKDVLQGAGEGRAGLALEDIQFEATALGCGVPRCRAISCILSPPKTHH